MNKQLLLIGLLFHGWLAIGQQSKPALFYRIGLEVGGSISTFVPQTVNIPIYNQRLGGRLGVFAMHRLYQSFDLRTGIFHTLRGLAFGDQPNPYNQDPLWNIHCISAPFMLFYHLSSRVNLALGVELNAIVESNLPIYRDELNIGIRGACGFYITKQCRIAAYYTHLLNRYWIQSASTRPRQLLTNAYNNIVAGISISFEFYQRRDYSAVPTFVHPCPRF